MPLILILVDCGLELIPNQIRAHPAVKKNINNIHTGWYIYAYFISCCYKTMFSA